MTRHNDPRTWQPRTQDGVEARARYLEMKAQERAANFRGTDEERIAFAEALLAQVKRNTPAPSPTVDEQNDDSLFR